MTSRPCPTCSGAGETIPDPCHKCGGDGRVRARRKLTVKIPAGVGDGMRVRLVGQGEVGPGGGPAGDLYVEVVEMPHSVFVRDGDDLHCTVRVPMVDAALGGELEIDTVLGGSTKVIIEPGTQPGQVAKVRGQGMPHLHTGVRGALHVHLDVVVPDPPRRAADREAQGIPEALGHDQIELVNSESSNTGGLFSRLRNAFAGR